MATILGELLAHNRWATLRLLDACAALPDEVLDATAPGTFGSIRATLVHLVANEEHYLAGITGVDLENPLDQGGPFPGFDDLSERINRTGARLEELAENAPAGGEDWTVEGIHQGEAFAIPASIFLMQTIDHATEHRTQIKTILTQRGIDPPTLDAWAYEASRQ